MKKAELKERLKAAKATRQLHDTEMKRMSSRITTLESELYEAKGVPLPDHVEQVIAGRVEIALASERERAPRDARYMRARVLQELLNDLKLEMLEPGTQEYWNEFRDWLKGRTQ